MGATKGRLYSKLLKEITVAARLGGGDPAANGRLRTLLSAAREANVPGDSVQRAVKRGTGELEGAHYEEVTYEGYGPGGVAVLVECLTDNRNRTASEVRNAFGRWDGNMGAEGAVAWTFQRKGAVSLKAGPSEERVLEVALEAGAEDVVDGGEEGFEVRCAPADLHQVAAGLEAAGLVPSEQRFVFLPQSTVRLEGDAARKMLKLMEALEENDDVRQVHANFEMDDALLQEMA